MPDVARSDSQRSDTSLRPRVSFNRDVHVKRIVPREGTRVSGALNGDGNGHLVASPVRKERLKGSKQQLAQEAAQVLHQADQHNCVSNSRGVLPEKFYTLQTRRKPKPDYPTASLDRKWAHRNNISANSQLPPEKPQRTFATLNRTTPAQKASVFEVFKRKGEPKKSNLRRSASDASNLKSKTFREDIDKHVPISDLEDNLNGSRCSKKQLSPIIEVTPREDYFSSSNGDSNKENLNSNKSIDQEKPKSITEKLKEYIDEVDEELYKDTGYRKEKKRETKDVGIVIIDVDKAEKISSNSKKSKLKNNSIGKKFRQITGKKIKPSDKNDPVVSNIENNAKQQAPAPSKKRRAPKPPPAPAISTSSAPRIKNATENFETIPKSPSSAMIHSSQKPAEKLPLTKGRTVNSMVRRLNHDTCSPPPKPNVMVRPSPETQHNNNQPFSYTRGLSPEKYSLSEENLTKPVIYAQVVCNNNGLSGGTAKQTIHTTFNRKHVNSDSDEGLGIEDSSLRKYRTEKTFTRFGDDVVDKPDDSFSVEKESPILPKYRITTGYNYEERSFNQLYVDSNARGRADGMDAKRRESLSEQIEAEIDPAKLNGRSDLSVRRDLLESRINRRIHDKTSKFNQSGGSSSPSPVLKEAVPNSKTYFGEHKTMTNTRTTNYHDQEPKSFDSQFVSDYRSSPENKQFEPSHRRFEETERTLKARNVYKSTPDIYHQQHNESQTSQHNSYHDSLRRERHQTVGLVRVKKNDKDRLGDSGIENDIARRDSGENLVDSQQVKAYRDYANDSEDEGFASSLLIASERQHTEENLNRRTLRKEYDSDRAYSGEDDLYRRPANGDYHRIPKEYIPRERSIDDGSHFDPRIDKEFQKESSTLKRVEQKPPKPEKKSGLEKVKQLFSRDSKKKKIEKKDMVREESLRARYTEYRGSREHLEPRRKKEPDDIPMDYDYSTRRRLSTPSISPTREIQQTSSTTSNEKPADSSSYSNWFKSLDRLSRKKNKKEEPKVSRVTEIKDDAAVPTKRASPKNLRFFGDTDADSSDGTRAGPSSYKQKSAVINQKDRIRSQSTRELHNIKEELSNPELNKRKKTHKSMTNISEGVRDIRGSRTNLKPPASPSHKFSRETPSRTKDDKGRRRKYDFSSVESSTEGDSSQQSQRSIVYLHAATVGDIPGPAHLRNGKRTASREELASNDSGRVQPQVKTLSRSFSVLAPWKPRHYHEGNDIDYSQQSKPVKYEQKITKNGSSRKENVSTLKKKAQDSKRSNQNSTSTMGRVSKSKENLSRYSKEDLSKGSSSTLYKKKDRLPRENSRYSRDKDDKKMASKSMSVESLSRNSRTSERKGREPNRDISRSLSMPKDPEKSAGWFKMGKTNRNPKTEYAKQRL